MLTLIDMFAERVRRFSERTLGLRLPAEPTPLNKLRRVALITHLQEELNELDGAQSLLDAADACVDVAWIAIRGLLEMGFSGPAAVAEVARANDDKVPGTNAKRPGDCNDAVKPSGWHGPDWDKVEERSRLADCLVHEECGAECPFRGYKAPGRGPAMTPGGGERIARILGAGMTTDVRERAARIAWDTPAQPGRYDAQPQESDFAFEETTVAQEAAAGGDFVKHDAGKDCRPELVPAPFLWELGRLFAAGARKYAEENWRKGRDLQRYVGALERHVLAWRMGESHDQETGVHHLVCAAWNCCVIFVTETQHWRDVTRGPDADTAYDRGTK